MHKNLDSGHAQETKVSSQSDQNIKVIIVILFPGKCRHYRLGFEIYQYRSKPLIKYESVNDRIEVATFRLSGRENLKIINVYGPTLDKLTKSPEERERF